MKKPAEILEFWRSIGPKGWWKKDDNVDRQIKENFEKAHANASAGKFSSWETDPDNALALIILLDQFSRNLFRGDAKSFAQDQMALDIAKSAIEQKFDQKVDPELKNFIYLPLMHSEKIGDQEQCLLLMHADGDVGSVKSAIIHRAIIARFGRFPHRNAVLGRHTSPAEIAFLKSGGFGG